jgi:hypothetical protein
MHMKDHLSNCQRRARQIKSDYPESTYTQRLDIAAKEQGFRHFTSLRKLHNLLGSEGTPTEIAIAMVGGHSLECPYGSVDIAVGIGWSS